MRERLRDPRQAAIVATLVTAIWGGTAGITAVVTGVSIASIALLGFGFEALIDATASAFLAWRFHVAAASTGKADRLESIGQRGIGIAFLAAGTYIALRSGVALIEDTRAQPSTFALIQAAASLAILPALGVVKIRLSQTLESRALRGDGILTTVGALLAALTLLGLLVNRTLGLRWPDRVAALLIAAVLFREGYGLLRHSN